MPDNRKGKGGKAVDDAHKAAHTACDDARSSVRIPAYGKPVNSHQPLGYPTGPCGFTTWTGSATSNEVRHAVTP
jgi:hypothetical protein